MGRKKWDAKNSKKKRPSDKHGLGRKKGKQIDPKKTRILNGTEKMGSKQMKKKGGILNGTEKKGSKQLQVKNDHRTKMDWEEKMGSK